MAGDYDVSLLGIYGDDIPLPETNRELVPLLQKLIKLLEEGGYVIPGGAPAMLQPGMKMDFTTIQPGAAGGVTYITGGSSGVTQPQGGLGMKIRNIITIKKIDISFIINLET